MLHYKIVNFVNFLYTRKCILLTYEKFVELYLYSSPA